MTQNNELSHLLTIDEWKAVQNKVTTIVKERGYNVTESLWFAHGYTHATGEWKVKYDELKAENEALQQQVATLHEKKKRGAEEHRKLFLVHAALKEKAQKLVNALKMIEQMSDPGSYEKAVYEMKSIASDVLSSWEGKV